MQESEWIVSVEHVGHPAIPKGDTQRQVGENAGNDVRFWRLKTLPALYIRVTLFLMGVDPYHRYSKLTKAFMTILNWKTTLV